jgi:hypothetical protein
MKKLLVLLTIFTALNFAKAADPEFSAFTSNNVLYVTVMGDSCNGYSGELLVDPSCKSDRLTRNLAPVCYATLRVSRTRMNCDGPDNSTPRMLKIDLEEAKVAHEAVILRLTYRESRIDVKINKNEQAE